MVRPDSSGSRVRIRLVAWVHRCPTAPSPYPSSMLEVYHPCVVFFSFFSWLAGSTFFWESSFLLLEGVSNKCRQHNMCLLFEPLRAGAPHWLCPHVPLPRQAWWECAAGSGVLNQCAQALQLICMTSTILISVLKRCSWSAWLLQFYVGTCQCRAHTVLGLEINILHTRNLAPSTHVLWVLVVASLSRAGDE
jgi:hypothetical protein